jgi:hypothetical protein
LVNDTNLNMSENKIIKAISTIDKCLILENDKWNDYQNDFDEFKKDIPKLEKTIDVLVAVKKYLNNNKDLLND